MTRPAVRLSDELLRRIIDHCRSEAPNEGCGLLAIDGNDVVEVYPTANQDGSPVGYTIPPREHFAALSDAESKGWDLGGVFHSHPNGEARPSMIDVQNALDPGWVYLIVGMSSDPDVRAWSIADGDVAEIEIRRPFAQPIPEAHPS